MRITFFRRKTPDLTAAFQTLHVFLKGSTGTHAGLEGPGGPCGPAGGLSVNVALLHPNMVCVAAFLTHGLP